MHEWQPLSPGLCLLSCVLFEVDCTADVIVEGSLCLGVLRFACTEGFLSDDLCELNYLVYYKVGKIQIF